MNNPKTSSIIDEHTAAHVAELFRAFSDTSRVRILSVLTTQELNVNALAALVGVSEFGCFPSPARPEADEDRRRKAGWERGLLPYR